MDLANEVIDRYRRGVAATLLLFAASLLSSCQRPERAGGTAHDRGEAGQPTSPAKPSSPMKTGIENLDKLIALRSASRDALASELGTPQVNPDRAYEGLVPVDQLRFAALSAFVYARGERIVMIYCEDKAFLQPITATGITAALGKPGLLLRSRAGKTSNLAAYPEHGIAFSSDNDTAPVEFLEVFPPMTPDEYRRDVYRDPGPFIR